MAVGELPAFVVIDLSCSLVVLAAFGLTPTTEERVLLVSYEL